MRATEIEKNLEAVKLSLANTMLRAVHGHLEVTQLFASAALVYLHVVVSGFQYSLAEIRENVARSITLFKRLPCQKILCALVWPMCIIGCMALEEQEGFFRDLIASMGVEPYVFGSARDALKTMENCWKKREARDEGWNWASCMNSSGHLVLIV